MRIDRLNLLGDLQDEFDITSLSITHVSSTVRHFCDRVAVTYPGEVMERGTTGEIFQHHQHR